MSRSLILACCILVGCTTTPQTPMTAEEAFGLDKGPGPGEADATIVPTQSHFSEDDVKLCLQTARAQAQSAEELADCILLMKLPLKERIVKAQAAAQKADEARQSKEINQIRKAVGVGASSRRPEDATPVPRPQ